MFDCSGFDDSCAWLLADVFVNLQLVRKLSIANTFITASGASALLKQCTSLLAFDTHAVDLSELQPFVIQRFFESNPGIEYIDFSYCQLTRFPLLQHIYPKVHVLKIAGNNLNVSDLAALRSAIRVVEDA